MTKSGRSPPDPHVPPFAYYELGVLYAKDEKVSHVTSKSAVLERLGHVPVYNNPRIPVRCGTSGGERVKQQQTLQQNLLCKVILNSVVVQ